MTCPVCQRPIAFPSYRVPLPPRLSLRVDAIIRFEPENLVVVDTCSQACGQVMGRWLRLKRDVEDGLYQRG